MNAIASHEERLFKMTLKAAVIYDDFDFAARAAALLERVAIRGRSHEVGRQAVEAGRAARAILGRRRPR